MSCPINSLGFLGLSSLAKSVSRIASSALSLEKNFPFRLSNASFSRADIGKPVTNPKCVSPPATISPITRISGSTSVTFGSCVIFVRAASSSTGAFSGFGVLASSSLSKPRKSCREVTKTVSNMPDPARRRVANCCSPTPSESIATSDATPTEIPTVVSPLRNFDWRRLRTASSSKS